MSSLFLKKKLSRGRTAPHHRLSLWEYWHHNDCFDRQRQSVRSISTSVAMNITRSITSERDRALLNGDYDAYHAQATRRIHTLRRRLGTATPRGRKYTPKAQVTAENVAQNTEWVQLLLASAERAWATAMAMKSAQSPENTQKPMPGSTKRQIASRLKRAISYAENLVAVLDESTAKASKLDTLEAKAYLFMLKGSLDFEKSRWQQCLRNYALPRITYASLGKGSKNDVYKDLLTGIVDPSIRYGAYQLKMPRTKPVEEIAIENFPSSESKAKGALTELDSQAFQTAKEVAAAHPESQDNPTHITWRTRKVKLEDAVISQALGTAIGHEKTLEQKFLDYKNDKISATDLAAAYDDIIEARQDAADATKSAIDDLTAEGVEAGDSRIQSLQVTRTAVNYAVIEYRIGRNRVLCGPADGLHFEPEVRKQPTTNTNTTKKSTQPKPESTGRQLSRLRERTALYDSILQSLESVKDLPGVIADTSFVTELDAKHSYFRALKCLAIGRSHALHHQTANALALFARALDLSQTASSTLPPSSSSSITPSAPKLDLPSTALSTTQTHLTTLVTRHRALADLHNLSQPPSSSSTSTKTPTQTPFTRPLAETLHLNIYHPDPDLTNIVNYPAKFRPIPVKPLFFDVAWEYIDYPGHGKNVVLQGVKKDEEGDAKGVVEKVAEAVGVSGGGGGTATGGSVKVKKEEQEDAKPAEKKKGWFGFGR